MKIFSIFLFGVMVAICIEKVMAEYRFLNIDVGNNVCSNADDECCWLVHYKDVVKTINNRPDFPKEVTKAFEITHFGESEGANGLHLAHVISWYDIRCRLDELFEQAFKAEENSEKKNIGHYVKIKEFLKKIFEIDGDAVVNEGPWYPPLTKDGWFEQIPTFRYFRRAVPTTDDNDYMTGTLLELRDKYLKEAIEYIDNGDIDFWKETHPGSDDPDDIKERNGDKIKDLFQLAFAASTNLRYGDGSSNSGIGENFDPMGDKYGVLTKKETEMLKNWVVNSEPEQFPRGTGEWFIRSSTGKYQPDPEEKS